MNYNLFLDDYRDPQDCYKYTSNQLYIALNWVVVRNYDEFVKCVEMNGIPDTISFDHDLSILDYSHQENIDYDYQEKTGFHCAKWFINYCIENNLQLSNTIMIHSMNRVGGENIKSLFDTYYKIYNK